MSYLTVFPLLAISIGKPRRQRSMFFCQVKSQNIYYRWQFTDRLSLLLVEFQRLKTPFKMFANFYDWQIPRSNHTTLLHYIGNFWPQKLGSPWQNPGSALVMYMYKQRSVPRSSTEIIKISYILRLWLFKGLKAKSRRSRTMDVVSQDPRFLICGQGQGPT